MLFDTFLGGDFLWLLVEFAHFHLSETVKNVVVLRIAEADLSHPKVFYSPQEQQQLMSFPGVPFFLSLFFLFSFGDFREVFYRLRS
jgi:hypothetical protein